MPRESQSTRFDRIEAKLDKLAEVVVTMARAEEKISALSNDHDKMHERLNKLSAKLDDIEVKVVKNSQTTATIHKLFWVVIAAVVAAVTAQVFNWF